MKYKQISLKVKHEEADITAYAFIEAGSEGVNIVDGREFNAEILSGRVWDYYDESLLSNDTENAVITGGFAEDFDVSVLSAILSKYLGRDVKPNCALCDSVDWEKEWQKYYKPIDFGGLSVVPAWLADSAPKGKPAVLIEPGMAFGTGMHETTGMCIKLLQSVDLNGKSVADVGCGSGILGIAALSLGANSCDFIDNDSQAADATRKNLTLNDMTNQRISCADLTDGVGRVFDVVIANITADVLMRLSRDLNRVLAPHGYVIISGIIDCRLADVAECYAIDFDTVTSLHEREWNALLLKKR